jgi:hypothetical protein
MDNAHFDELLGELSLTVDTRLLEFAKRNRGRFLNLLTKMLETAVEFGVTEPTLHHDVNNACENVPRLGHNRLPACVCEKLHGKSFEILWGPNIGRPAGYYVSIPEYDGGRVIRMSDVEDALREGIKA